MLGVSRVRVARADLLRVLPRRLLLHRPVRCAMAYTATADPAGRGPRPFGCRRRYPYGRRCLRRRCHWPPHAWRERGRSIGGQVKEVVLMELESRIRAHLREQK